MANVYMTAADEGWTRGREEGLAGKSVGYSLYESIKTVGESEKKAQSLANQSSRFVGKISGHVEEYPVHAILWVLASMALVKGKPTTLLATTGIGVGIVLFSKHLPEPLDGVKSWPEEARIAINGNDEAKEDPGPYMLLVAAILVSGMEHSRTLSEIFVAPGPAIFQHGVTTLAGLSIGHFLANRPGDAPEGEVSTVAYSSYDEYIPGGSPRPSPRSAARRPVGRPERERERDPLGAAADQRGWAPQPFPGTGGIPASATGFDGREGRSDGIRGGWPQTAPAGIKGYAVVRMAMAGEDDGDGDSEGCLGSV